MKDVTSLYYAIKEKSDAISAILLQEIRDMIGAEYQELTQRQAMLLSLLKQQNMTVNEIAEFFSITASAASQLIKKLEEKDYVRRDINQSDRREIIVRLGDTGKAYNDKIDEVEIYLMEKYYGQLSREDLEKLKEITDKLYDVMLQEQRL